MSYLVFACFVPHPPLIIPAVGRGRLESVRSTISALQKLSQKIAKMCPERLVVITPHGPLFRDRPVLLNKERLEGDFAQFGAFQEKVSLEIDRSLSRLIAEEAGNQGINVLTVDLRRARQYGVSLTLDHGAGVPLYYLAREGVKVPGVCLTPGFLSYRKLFNFGKALRSAIEKGEKRTVVITSGDLSHRLIEGAPAGYNPHGKIFDEQLVELLQECRIKDILNMDPELIESAAECGFRPLLITLGAMDSSEMDSDILSYEGPFGVGYLVAAFTPREKEEMGSDAESFYVRLARKALELYVQTGERLELRDCLPQEMKQRAGVFVSLKKDGRLRGCIGTFAPACVNLAEEIIESAISAGTKDPRFPPLTPAELAQVCYTVDIISTPERIMSEEELDPKLYGVLIRSGERRALLLPDIEGVDTVERQMEIVREKAGIVSDSEPVELHRFTVNRYH